VPALRRRILYFLLIGLAAVLFAYALAAFWNHAPPNYTLMEPGLYLGGYVAEPPPGVTAVLNLEENEDRYQVEQSSWQPIVDGPPAPSLEWLQEQVDFIDEQRAAGRTVYVHCRNGVSRSSTVVAAYLMQRHGWTLEQTLAEMRKKRPEVRPNPTFMPLLEAWQKRAMQAPLKTRRSDRKAA
jgi:protein-tyrosine phosphatase